MEIIPNWHPIFVHFTVALLSVSAMLYAVATLAKGELKRQCNRVARWNLWIGAVLTLVTLATGWYAYNTVTHDDPAHIAMTDHRNWALTTASVFLVLAVWSWRAQVRKKAEHGIFVVVALVGAGLLAATAWHGGELVYRHGLGVMSLPQSQSNPPGDGHAQDPGGATGVPADTDNDNASAGHGDHDHAH